MFCWTVHVKGGQQPNFYPAVAVENKVYSFGGLRDDNSAQIDVHVFNTVSLRWRKLTPVTTGRERHLEVPSRRMGYTAVLIDAIVYVWGGLPYCNVLYTFDVDAHRWFKPRISGTVPVRKYDHSACVLGKFMFIHGGYSQRIGQSNDIYKLDTSTQVWSLISTRGTPPHASWNYSATIIGTKMFVFGGWGGYKAYRLYGEFYNPAIISVFDTETNCWMNSPSAQPHPERRSHHSAFTYNGELYIFGGISTSYMNLNDLWKFNPETFCWKKVEPKGKGPVPTHGMCCCMMGDRIIFFGGVKTPDDLYSLDLSPSLKPLCKLAVIQYGLEQSGLPHNIRWELAAMTSNMVDLLRRHG